MTVKDRLKITEKTLKNKKNERILKCALFFMLGMLFSLGSVFGELRPFGVSITAVSKKRYFLFTAAGAAFATLFTGLDGSSARYMCAITLAALGTLASAAFELGVSPAFSMSVSFASSLITGFILDYKIQAAAGAYLLTLGEAILSCGAAYFFYRALNSNYKRLRFRALPAADLTCIIISLSIMLMNLSSFTVYVVSPAVTISVFLILLAIRFLGERRGVALALALGFAISLNFENGLFCVGALAFSALTASLFTGLNAVGTGAAFLACTAFFSIAANTTASLTFGISSAIGTAAFILLPPPAVKRLAKLSEGPGSVSPDGALRQSLVLKLRFASSALSAISESVEQVREKINEMTRRENEKNKDSLSQSEYLQKEIILEKTNRIRKVASDQLYSVADMLEDLAFEFDEAELFDSAATAKIRRVLGEHEIYPLNISAIEDKFGRMRVEILTDSDFGLNNPKLAPEIGRACSRYFDKGIITNFKNETMLSFFERPNYSLCVGFAQHSAQGHLCGDTVKILNDSKGHSILIISDGMGKGSRAALDGAMGAGLLSKLLGAGFGFDSALKTVNSALLIKSNDESLATLDVANIDLFTGKCEIYKAGAPASFIIRNENLIRCELASMPAGILRGIEFAKRTAVLKLNDLIVLMSDGISELGDEWLSDLLLNIRSLEPQRAAELVVEEAIKIADEKTIDDMSIIIARLERNG